jgi:hypothetical protein
MPYYQEGYKLNLLDLEKECSCRSSLCAWETHFHSRAHRICFICLSGPVVPAYPTRSTSSREMCPMLCVEVNYRKFRSLTGSSDADRKF